MFICVDKALLLSLSLSFHLSIKGPMSCIYSKVFARKLFLLYGLVVRVVGSHGEDTGSFPHNRTFF